MTLRKINLYKDTVALSNLFSQYTKKRYLLIRLHKKKQTPL